MLAFCLGSGSAASGQTAVITTVAGSSLGSAVALNTPLGQLSGVAVYKGNIYIADSAGNRILLVASDGSIRIAAGNGSQGFSGDGGAATSASLSRPQGIAVDASGNLFIADNCRIRQVSAGSIISTVAGNGSCSFSGDGGPAISASLTPVSVAVDASGNLFIAEHQNCRIRQVSAGGIISTVAGNGSCSFSGDGGPAISASLNFPAGVAVDASGNLFIADQYNNRIRKVSANGIISTVAGNGAARFSGDGAAATSASLSYPAGIAVDASGNLLIVDSINQRIRKVSSSGIISTVAGNGRFGFSGDGGPAIAASLDLDPSFLPLAAVAVDASGNLFIADTFNFRIREVSVGGIISTVAGNGTPGFSGDGGPATSASLGGPTSVATDTSGNLFIADQYNARIRKVSATGIVTTVAGNGTVYPSSGDGGPATSASLSGPQALALDTSGNLFIADSGSGRIRKVSATGTITTVAGDGSYTFWGDGGPATSASLNDPRGVAVDASGNLFIADTQNNRIRKVSANGIITTVAGNGTSGFSGDNGLATSAALSGPVGLAVDASGNLFIADQYNNRIRKVTAATGMIATVAGNGKSALGDGGPATSASLSFPTGVAVDASGNLFIADTGNQRIREVLATGIITTVAGNGTAGFSGDGGSATSASLNSPAGIAVDAGGHLFIADTNNNRVREVLPQAPSLTAFPSAINLSLASGGSSTQQITLESPLAPIAWNAFPSANWITLTPTSGSGPGVVKAVVNAATLQPGTYTANIVISNSAPSPSQQSVSVTLIVTPSAGVSVSPATLTFQIPQGNPAQSQSLQIGGTTGAAWQATTATSTGGPWLTVSPAGGQAPASLTVLANPAGLPQGTYQGSIAVQAPGVNASSIATNVTLTVTASVPGGPPEALSANNSADYGTTLAQGSLFVVFGSYLGPGNLVAVSSFPLPNMLSGTSVTVTSGSTTLNCPMIYTSTGQVAAILPSNTPVGPATVTVAYNGITSNSYSPAQVTVAKSSVGVFTVNSRGLGTGVFTALDGTLKTYTNSAKPGDILTVWATGLGPIGTPDNVLPTAFPNFPNVQVWVGGQSANVVYAGRSGCCAAVDQISFTVPAVANGCNVPVVVVSGGGSSNTVSLPVSGSGGACTDTGPTLPTSILTSAAAGQQVKVAAIAIGPALFQGNAGANQAMAKRLSAALHTQVSEPDVAKLKRAFKARNPKAIRMAMLKYASRWKTLDAKTRATIAAQLGQTQEGALALFGGFGNEGVAAMIGGSQLPVAGSCVVLPNNYPSGLGVVNASLDAGPSLLLTSAAGSVTLKQTGAGQYRGLFGASVTGPDIPLGAYTISGAGGKDVGAFSSTITVGSRLAISNKSSLATVDRTQPLTLTWTGGVAGNYVLIMGNTPGTGRYGDPYTTPANFACAEDAGKGTLTIPGYILSSLSATASGKGTLLILPHPLSNQITIPGIDLAYFADGSSDSVNVTFK